EEFAEEVNGPGLLAAFGEFLHGVGIVEVRRRCDGTVDDAEEIRPDLVRSALLEGMAGGAALGECLTLGWIGRRDRFCETAGRLLLGGGGGNSKNEQRSGEEAF